MKERKKAVGLFEYLIFKDMSTSSILASLIMASFLVATILPLADNIFQVNTQSEVIE